MEKRLQTKIERYNQGFKDDIKEWFNDNKYRVVSTNDQEKLSELLQYIYDYNNFQVDKEDFQKRKRTKNSISHFERCTAKRANGEQCTRRKKENSSFCGTHIKGTPHGVQTCVEVSSVNTKKVEVWIQEIKGINYYIDAENNVYRPDDIIGNKTNPSIIAKWTLNDEGKYCIPNFNI
jgi:hypothetical protein